MGANINNRDHKLGYTPLHSLIDNTQADHKITKLKFLLENGAEMAIENSQGLKALDFAVDKLNALKERARPIPSLIKDYEEIVDFLNTYIVAPKQKTPADDLG